MINIIDYDDTVEITWTSNNMKYYIEKGYQYTKTRDKFMVKIKDLPSGSQIKYPITCDICNKIFYSSNNVLNRSKNINLHTCNNCKLVKSVKTRMAEKLDIQWDKLKIVCNNKGYKLISTIDSYSGVRGQIYYECPIHGKQHSSYNNLISGHGCYKCAKEYTANLQRNSSHKIINYINSINNNQLLNPEEYVKGDKINLKILCGLCGENTFITSFTNYRLGCNRCEFCRKSMSAAELTIKRVLEKYNIKYKQEKTFPDCKDKKVLPFDFYLYDYNKCIEFDGEQHYNMNYDITMKTPNPEEAFATRKKHDQIKTDYCNNHNIGLLRIPYYKENHIEEIITEDLGIFK